MKKKIQATRSQRLRTSLFMDKLKEIPDRSYESIINTAKDFMNEKDYQFYFRDYPSIWLLAHSEIVNETTIQNALVSIYEHEKVRDCRIMGEEQEEDGTAKGKNVLYIRTIEVNGKTNFYIGITDKSSKERMKNDPYYYSNKPFHADIEKAFQNAIDELPDEQLSHEDKLFLKAELRNWFWPEDDWGKQLPRMPAPDPFPYLERTLNITGVPKKYYDIREVLNEFDIPMTFDASDILTGKQVCYLERMLIDVFDLVETDLGYNRQAGGDYRLPWPIEIEKDGECIAIANSVEEAADKYGLPKFKSLNDSLAYMRELNAEKPGGYSIRFYAAEGIEIPHFLKEYFTSGRGGGKSVCVIENEMVKKYFAQIKNALEHYADKKHDRTDPQWKKEYNAVKKCLNKGEPIKKNSGKMLIREEDIIPLKIPDTTSLSPKTWHAFIRSDNVPKDTEKWGYKKIVHSGYEKEYMITVWEKDGIGYWHSDMGGIMRADKELLERMPNVRYMEGWKGLYFGLEDLEKTEAIIRKILPKAYLAEDQIEKEER